MVLTQRCVCVVADADAVAALGAQRQHRGDLPLHGAARGTLEVSRHELDQPTVLVPAVRCMGRRRIEN